MFILNSNNYLALVRCCLRTRILTLTIMCVVAVLSPSQVALGMALRGTVADLTLSKSGDEAVPRGGNITYSVVVNNGGPDTAANVIVTDPLPAHTTFVNASVTQGSATFNAGTITANLGAIASQESATLTIVVSINEDTPRDTTISNTATVTSDTFDPETSNNSATAFTAVIGAFAGDLLISEFRLRGPGTNPQGRKGLNNSATDEFIEIYNNTGSAHSVAAGSGTGYS